MAPGSEILDEHVALRNQGAQDLDGFGLLEIEGERLLAPVEPDEIGREALHGGVVGAGEIAAAGALDLDDFGAEIGQMPGAERSGNGLFEREHANSGQWRRGHRWVPCVRRWFVGGLSQSGAGSTRHEQSSARACCLLPAACS